MATELPNVSYAPCAQCANTSSAGVAICSDCDAPEETLRRAAVALHEAKLQPHHPLHLLKAEDDRAFVERVELGAQLAGAAERGELRLHFQPIVSAASGRVAGAEALVRWEHSERGLVPPVELIPLAEETGSISKIGCWVLGEACRALPDGSPPIRPWLT